MNIYLQMFISFFKIGAFTFGGGWPMIPIIEKEVVDKKMDRPNRFYRCIGYCTIITGHISRQYFYSGRQ
ncbi:MAG: chromate transporter [Barnesiella sp.]